MSKDPTFRVLGAVPGRSERYEAYRREWDRRESETDPSDHPVHGDIMMNTNGNGGARKNPELFAQLVEAGITDLMFSVDACDPDSYHRQRVGGKWEILLHSVRSATKARAEGKGAEDCRIRASVVRT